MHRVPLKSIVDHTRKGRIVGSTDRLSEQVTCSCGLPEPRFREVVNWHKSCRGIWDIVTEPRIIDVVADLLGDSVILRHSHLFAKLPGDAKRVAWHQDAS